MFNKKFCLIDKYYESKKYYWRNRNDGKDVHCAFNYSQTYSRVYGYKTLNDASIFMNYKETENLIKKESFKEHNNCESLKADHNDSINLPSNSKYKDLCIFSRHVDFLKMTEDNWFHEEICDDDWNKQRDPEVIESCELEKNCDITLDNHKQESQIKVDKCDDNLVNIIDLSNIRSDVQMKSILRKIRRDLRTLFFRLTHFDVKVRMNRVQNFNQSLNILSYHLFGENPTKKQTLTLGKKFT